jgi:hypothetical protein
LERGLAAPGKPGAAANGPFGDALDQATQLRDAIALAYCQPAVSAFLNFGLLDEDRLGGWQSGLLWRDGQIRGAPAS